jgi:hypothetical protein
MDNREASEGPVRLEFRLLEGGTKIEHIRSSFPVEQKVLDEWLSQVPEEYRLQAGDVTITILPLDAYEFVFEIPDGPVSDDRYAAAQRVAFKIELRYRYYEDFRERTATI